MLSEGWETVVVMLYEDAKNNPENPRYLMAKVIKTDPKIDLALIQLINPPRSMAHIALGKIPDVGSDVHAIGHPYGEDWTYTKGYVSQIRNNYDWDYYDRDSSDEDPVITSSHNSSVIQTQTPINPGNSGGPLLNPRRQTSWNK